MERQDKMEKMDKIEKSEKMEKSDKNVVEKAEKGEEEDEKRISRALSSTLPRTQANFSKVETKKMQIEFPENAQGLSDILIDDEFDDEVETQRVDEEEDGNLGVNKGKVERRLEEGRIKVGYLIKKGGMRKNWTTRYFILRPTTLTYYKAPTEVAKGVITLDAHTKIVDLHERRAYSFLITNGVEGAREYWVAAADSKEHLLWMEAIGAVIREQGKSRVEIQK
jgi:hypothetical protein